MPVKIRGSSGIDRIHPDVLERKNLVTTDEAVTINNIDEYIPSKSFISVWDNDSGTDFSAGAYCSMTNIRHRNNTSDFLLSDGIITCKKAGNYLITYDCTCYTTTADSRSTGRAELRHNNTFVDGSHGYMYSRVNNNEWNTATCSVIKALSVDDTIRLWATRVTGSAALLFQGDANRITIMEIL
jgi:hypothetical protein